MKKELTKEELKDFIEVVLKGFKNHPFPDMGIEYNNWTIDIMLGLAEHLEYNYDDLIKSESSELLFDVVECINEFNHELVYTSDLTEWLNTSNNYVYYLTDAISEFGARDGFEALAFAYYCFVEDIKNNIIRYLTEIDHYLEENHA